MSMIRHLILFVFTISSLALSAQRGRVGMLEYAAGGRLGTGTGLTFQYFHTDNHVAEAIIYARFEGFSATALYEHHMQVLDVYGLKWYIGAGGHASFYPVGTTRPDLDQTIAGNVFIPGVDAIIGLEYFFRSAPLQMSCDIKPEYNFGILNSLDTTIGAVSLRYRF